MPQFHETGYGRTYYEYQLPEITRQLTRIADALEKLNEVPEKKAVAKTTTTPGITKRSAGEYTLEIKEDIWHIWKDPYSRISSWRAECTAGTFKDKHFKELQKKDVLNNIYECYNDESAGVSGETGIGNN